MNSPDSTTPPISLLPSLPRPRHARHTPRDNCWDPAWATAEYGGAHLAPCRGPRSRGAVPSICLAAGARIVQARDPAGRRWKVAVGTVRNLWQPIRARRSAPVCVLLLQDLLQSCSRGGRRRVEDMCYERRRAEACVDESAHHALVNAGGREIV
jgi:hypothetical protein